MSPPRLAPGTPFERKAGTDEVRTVTRTTPRRPVSKFHHAGRWWLRHHLDRDESGEWRDESGWGGHRSGPARVRGLTREDVRADMRLAQHAQDLRAEAVTLGGREETARFYGRGEFAGRGEVGGIERTERRILVGDAERTRSAYELEQAARYAGRRRRGEAAIRRARRGTR